MNTRFLAVATATALTFGGAAQAASFGTYDPRSMGMGGIGTSAGGSGNASFYNPALLGPSARADLYAVELPVIGVRIADPNDFIEAVDDTEEAIDNFDEAQNTLDSLDNFDPSNQEELEAALDDLSSASGAIGTMGDAFGNIDNRPMEFEVFGGVLLGVSASGTGMAFHSAARGMGGFRVDVDDADTAMFDGYSDGLEGLIDHLDNGNYGTDYGASGDAVYYDGNTKEIQLAEMDSLKSRFSARGAIIHETGVSLARDFTVRGEPFSFGITPKYLSVSTFDFDEPFEDADIEVDEGTKEHTAFDLDLGASRMWDVRGHNVRGGVVIKNLLGHSFDTTLGNSIDLKPQLRAGVSHHTRFSTVGLDLDLLENKAMAKGFDQPTQYLGLGGEFDAWRILQLRIGYRTDLAGSYEDTIHAGVGLFSLVDVGAAMSDDEYQVGVRTGFRW